MHTAIMIPTGVPSPIVIATDNHRPAFAVNSSESAIMVAVSADADVDTLSKRGYCDAQSHNRRYNNKSAAHWNSSSKSL
jgi:hypothetical protein